MLTSRSPACTGKRNKEKCFGEQYGRRQGGATEDMRAWEWFIQPSHTFVYCPSSLFSCRMVCGGGEGKNMKNAPAAAGAPALQAPPLPTPPRPVLRLTHENRFVHARCTGQSPRRAPLRLIRTGLATEPCFKAGENAFCAHGLLWVIRRAFFYGNVQKKGKKKNATVHAGGFC